MNVNAKGVQGNRDDIPAAHPGQEWEEWMARPSVMVIEPDVAILELMRDILSFNGYRPILCRKGEAAFDQILHERPEVIILDLSYGHEAIGEMVLGLLKIDPHTRQTPVILMSTDPMIMERKKALLEQIGCAVVIKPFSMDCLLEKMEATMQARRFAAHQQRTRYSRARTHKAG